MEHVLPGSEQGDLGTGMLARVRVGTAQAEGTSVWGWTLPRQEGLFWAAMLARRGSLWTDDTCLDSLPILESRKVRRLWNKIT